MARADTRGPTFELKWPTSFRASLTLRRSLALELWSTTYSDQRCPMDTEDARLAVWRSWLDKDSILEGWDRKLWNEFYALLHHRAMWRGYREILDASPDRPETSSSRFPERERPLPRPVEHRRIMHVRALALVVHRRDVRDCMEDRGDRERLARTKPSERYEQPNPQQTTTLARSLNGRYPTWSKEISVGRYLYSGRGGSILRPGRRSSPVLAT